MRHVYSADRVSSGVWSENILADQETVIGSGSRILYIVNGNNKKLLALGIRLV